MYKLWPFFAGKLAREEATSAFLAMLMEGSPAFRGHFFTALPAELAKRLNGETFKVSTEVREVDIRLDSIDSNAVVLIENKILASSVSRGQLLRYYKAQIEAEPDKQVVLVYLAPGDGVGRGEIRRVKQAPEFTSRSADVVYRMSWSRIMRFQEQLDATRALDALLLSGFEAVEDAIDASRAVRFPEEGERAPIIRAVRTALESLRAWNPEQRFALWAMRNRHQVEIQKSNVTIYIGAEFDVGPEPENKPIGVVEGDILRVRLKSIFGQSAAGAKQLARKRAWQVLLDAGEVHIEGLGAHTLDAGQRWFGMDEDFAGTESELAEALVARMKAVMAGLASHL